MKCEIVREGQACDLPAGFIVRTPWTTQLACNACATSFKRYETQKLEFFCDWPVSGRECGEKATYYFAGEGFQRPLCANHAVKLSSSTNVYHIIDARFNPKLVPHKPPAQPPPRVVLSGDKLGLFCHCGASGKYRGGVEPMPLCDEHWTPTPKAEPLSSVVDVQPTDVLSALEDLALTTIRILKEKIEAWR